VLFERSGVPKICPQLDLTEGHLVLCELPPEARGPYMHQSNEARQVGALLILDLLARLKLVE
jgi:hypothetical protein